MRPADGIELSLRRRAKQDAPGCAIACADRAAWAQAEGEGSAAEAEAIRRRDIERYIPGLAARKTYMTIGWVISAAVVVTSGLSLLPDSPWVDIATTLMTDGLSVILLALAAWSIVSEVRGWEGSDASTWFLKRRVKRFDKTLEARRHMICDTLLAIHTGKLTVYRNEAGTIVAQTFTQDNVDRISLQYRDNHMSLHLDTTTGAFHFDWLIRDTPFESEVTSFAALIEAKNGPEKAATQYESMSSPMVSGVSHALP